MKKDITEYKRLGVQILGVYPPTLQGEVYETHPDWRQIATTTREIPQIDILDGATAGGAEFLIELGLQQPHLFLGFGNMVGERGDAGVTKRGGRPGEQIIECGGLGAEVIEGMVVHWDIATNPSVRKMVFAMIFHFATAAHAIENGLQPEGDEGIPSFARFARDFQRTSKSSKGYAFGLGALATSPTFKRGNPLA